MSWIKFSASDSQFRDIERINSSGLRTFSAVWLRSRTSRFANGWRTDDGIDPSWGFLLRFKCVKEVTIENDILGTSVIKLFERSRLRRFVRASGLKGREAIRFPLKLRTFKVSSSPENVGDSKDRRRFPLRSRDRSCLKSCNKEKHIGYLKTDQ